MPLSGDNFARDHDARGLPGMVVGVGVNCVGGNMELLLLEIACRFCSRE